MHEPARQTIELHDSAGQETIRRVAAVVSGASRVGSDAVVAAFSRVVEHESELEVQVTNSSAEATEAASQAARWATVVVAVGGDGTVADVATGIFGSPAALGIIPAGSTNIVARSLGIPAQPTAALALLGGAFRLRAIDVGRSEDRSFLHIAGAGLDAELFGAANPVWKRRLGWIAYLPAAAAALRMPPSEVHIVVDREVVEARTPLVLVANGGSAIAPNFRIYPGVAVDDGLLDVLVFTSLTATQVVATLGDAGRQRLDRSPYVIHRRGQTVSLQAEPTLRVQLDGDSRGTTPRQFRIVPLGLLVVTPQHETVARSR